MSDYNVVNGITRPPVTEQDKMIASVELAGWRIKPVHGAVVARYAVYNPQGNIVGYRSTRYTGALLAEQYLQYDDLEALMPAMRK